jgi:hypothetical protein
MTGGDRKINRFIEPLFVIAILAGIAHAMWFLSENLYLPQPFFFNPGDTYMDWFNTSYWAHTDAAYDTWATIYPPISFVFLKIFSIDACYENAEPSFARECDWLGMATLHGFWIVNIILVSWAYIKHDKSTALYRSIAVGAGLPMLYALDRGQLVVVTFAFVVLGFGNILHSARLRWLSIAVAINFKPYLIGAIFPFILKRQWTRFEGSAIAVVLVYGITWYIYGDGSPIKLYENIVGFADIFQAINFLDLWYSATYIPMLSLFAGPAPTTLLIGSDRLEFWEVAIPIIWRSIQILIFAAASLSFFLPRVINIQRLALLAIGLSLISSEAGGYTQVFLMFFVMLERWDSPFQKAAILIAYTLCIPAEIWFNLLPPFWYYSYFAERPVFLEYGLGMGPILRPGLILLMCASLALDTLARLYAAWRARAILVEAPSPS